MALQKRFVFLAVLVLTLAASAEAAPKSRIAWQRDLKKAATLSQQSNKPMLITFTASWCTYCHKLIGETFSDRTVAARVNDYFIPVVLDADANDQAVQLLAVEAFPTTLIISPELDVIGRITGFHKAPQMTQHLTPFCRSQDKKLRQAVVASIPMKPAAQPVAARKPAPKTAFGGMCLVSMLDDRKLADGDPTITAEFRSTRLHFASDEHRAAFLKSSDRYWPANDGNCPVATVLKEKQTLGVPETAAVYRGQIILFRSMQHRQDFAGDPRGFMSRMQAAKTSGEADRQQ